MGCDGGSIPRRAEMVKTKAKTEQIDDSEVLKTQWTCCFISKKPLERPIVACKLGRLYNKESVVMFLLKKQETDPALSSELSHIKSLKSLINCNLKSSSEAESRAEAKGSDYFVCPLTGREMNGKSKFYVAKTCGCAISDQAINQFPDTKSCLVCERNGFNRETDLIPLYAKGDELEKLRECQDREDSAKDIKKKRPVSDSTKINSNTPSVSSSTSLSEETRKIGALKRSKVTDTLYHK